MLGTSPRIGISWLTNQVYPRGGLGQPTLHPPDPGRVDGQRERHCGKAPALRAGEQPRSLSDWPTSGHQAPRSGSTSRRTARADAMTLAICREWQSANRRAMEPVLTRGARFRAANPWNRLPQPLPPWHPPCDLPTPLAGPAVSGTSCQPPAGPGNRVHSLKNALSDPSSPPAVRAPPLHSDLPQPSTEIVRAWCPCPPIRRLASGSTSS